MGRTYYIICNVSEELFFKAGLCVLRCLASVCSSQRQEHEYVMAQRRKEKRPAIPRPAQGTHGLRVVLVLR